MAEVSEADRLQIQLLSENIKEEFDEYIGVEVKSKKGNGIAIFCLGRSKLYLFQVHKGKATVTLETKHHGTVSLHTPRANEVIHVLRQRIFSEIYPGMKEKDNPAITVKVPEDRLRDLTKVDRPCGNFKAAYLAECEASNTPIREDIAFDVEHLFSANNVKEFNLEEFEGPLSTNDIKCLLGALRFNPYFTALKLRNLKMEKEQSLAILSCLRVNCAIESVSLGGIQTNKEFYVDLFKELQANKGCVVREIYLADNKEFGDTGVTQLSAWIAGLTFGISVLDLSNCAMRGKGIVALCNAFKKNVHVSTTLTNLDLSVNRLEADGSSALAAFLAQPNALTQLYLRDCGATLDLILGALNRGTSREIRELDISANKMTPKSSHLSIFVRSSSTITKLNVSATGFTAEMLKELLLSIKGNPYLTAVDLIASKNALGLAGARILMDEGGDMINITSLDLSENDFDDEAMVAVCYGLARCASVKRLDLSRNMPSRGRSRDLAIEGLISLITSPESALEHFTFCGGKGTQLGPDMIRLIDAMGDAILTGLDITGHAIGNKGASSLGKMLQSNRTLVSLIWDENGTNLTGFKNFRKGLKRNTTLKSMSLPILDIEAALAKENDKPTFLKVIRDIESCIVNNNSPKSKFKAKENKGGNEYLFFSTSQREALEHHIVKLKSKGKRPSEDDQIVIKDAENFETVIGDLHIAKADALSEMEAALKTKLQSMAEELAPLLAEHLNKLKRKMIETISQGYASLDSDTVRRIGTNISFGTREVDVKELQEVMVVAAGADISVKTAECYQSAVDIAADYCFEKLEDNLVQITERLQNEVEDAKTKPKKVKKHKKDRSDAGMVKDGSSSSLTTASSASSSKKEKKPKTQVLEESDDGEPASSADGAHTPEEDVGDVEEAGEDEAHAEDNVESTDGGDTDTTTSASHDGTSTPPVESSEQLERMHSAPNLAASGTAAPGTTPPLASMGGSGINLLSGVPKKMPPAIPKTGPPPTPGKFKLPPVGGASGGMGNGPPSPGETKFAPKGFPPKIPMGFPPKSPMGANGAPGGGLPGVAKTFPGKLAPPPMLVQFKLGGAVSATAGGTAKTSGPPPIPSVAGVKKMAPPPVAAAAAAAAATPLSTPSKPEDKSKDKKDSKDKTKDKTTSKPPSKTPASTKTTTKTPGKRKDEPAAFVESVKPQGAGSGLSAASTQVAPEGALDNLAQKAGAPMNDPRANRAAGAARRRPPTRRPQGPSAVCPSPPIPPII